MKKLFSGVKSRYFALLTKISKQHSYCRMHHLENINCWNHGAQTNIIVRFFSSTIQLVALRFFFIWRTALRFFFTLGWAHMGLLMSLICSLWKHKERKIQFYMNAIIYYIQCSAKVLGYLNIWIRIHPCNTIREAFDQSHIYSAVWQQPQT